MLAFLAYHTTTQRIQHFPVSLCDTINPAFCTWQRWLVCDKNLFFFPRQQLSLPERCVVIVVSQPVIAPRRKPQMMLRWSVFPRTVGIIAPCILSSLLCSLYLSLYFGLWEPAGHCTSDSTPSSMKTLEIKLSSACVHMWVCVSVWRCWLTGEEGVIFRQKIKVQLTL